MATGNEVVLGFPFEMYDEINTALGIKLPTETSVRDSDDIGDYEFESLLKEAFDEFIDTNEDSLDDLDRTLKVVHAACLNDAGFKHVSEEDWSTPLGNRTFSAFHASLFYEPDELGEDPRVTTFGVSLSGRYFPTFLDWRSTHGTLWPVRFNSDLNKMINIAKHRIVQAFPIFNKADIVVIERFY